MIMGGKDNRGRPMPVLSTAESPPMEGGDTRRNASGKVVESLDRWRLGDLPENIELGSRVLLSVGRCDEGFVGFGGGGAFIASLSAGRLRVRP